MGKKEVAIQRCHIPVWLLFTSEEGMLLVLLPAVFLLLYWFIIQFVSGVGSIGYSQVSSGGVAFFAHVGGFLAGMLTINMFPAKQRWGRWENW